MRSPRTRTLFACVLLCAVFAGPFCPVAAAGKFNRKLNAGDAAPVWTDLKGTDDKTHSLADLKEAKAVVVFFSCNHCPVAQAYEARLIELTKQYGAKGVKVVAISCSRLPQDGFEKMKLRSTERKYNFPYLHDADQEVAKSFGATTTPHVFVLDGERKIAYMGAFDDSLDASKVKARYVPDALDAVLSGKQPEIRETRQFGCGIEYE
jgi:peroxiredoxin